MKQITSLSEIPNTGAVYALYGGDDRNLYVAYVGVSSRLKDRIKQHLVRRDSSVTTGTTATGLNPDYVTRVRWWIGPEFSQREVLEAAELVAVEVLDPSLRSRGGVREESQLLVEDPEFYTSMKVLLEGNPTGEYRVLQVEDLVEQVEYLEHVVADLTERLDRLEDLLGCVK